MKQKQYPIDFFPGHLPSHYELCIWSPSFVGVAVVLHYTGFPDKNAPGIIFALIHFF